MIPTSIQKSTRTLLLVGLVFGLGLPSIVASDIARAQGESDNVENLIPEFQPRYGKCRRIGNVVNHNVCCVNQCQTACGAIKDFQLKASCGRSCFEGRAGGGMGTCLKKHSTQQYRQITSKKWDKMWMRNYCLKQRDRKKKDYATCCTTMYRRCYASCQGYPDKEINDCQDRCSQSRHEC